MVEPTLMNAIRSSIYQLPVSQRVAGICYVCDLVRRLEAVDKSIPVGQKRHLCRECVPFARSAEFLMSCSDASAPRNG